MAQIIQSPNLVFGVTIHHDSKLLHYLFICTANSYCTILLNVILRSALFDTSVPPVSAINCRLEGQQKTDQSSYQNIKQNMELVCHLWLHTILGFMIQVRSLEKILFIYMLNNKSNRSLHQPHLCCFGQVLVLGITQFEQKCTPCKERKGYHVVGKVGAKPALT